MKIKFLQVVSVEKNQKTNERDIEDRGGGGTTEIVKAIPLLQKSTTGSENLFVSIMEEILELREVKEEGIHDIIILFTQHKYLRDYRFVYSLLAKKSDITGTKFFGYEGENYAPKPVIIISYKDIMKPVSDKVLETLRPNRRYLFLDSSVWTYFVAMEHSDFLERINEVLSHIKSNMEKKLYDLNIGKEYIEFQARLMFQSYLQRIGGHSRHIVPFHFHSERVKYLDAKKIKCELHEKFNHVYLRCLLIDDKANTNLNGINATEEEEGIKKFGKLYNIQRLFNDKVGLKNSHTPWLRTVIKKKSLHRGEGETDDSAIFLRWHEGESALDKIDREKNNEEIVPGKIDLSLEYAETYEDALYMLKTQRYDIILLDYLLDPRPDGFRYYGSEIIKELRSGSKEYKRGPFERFWIFPITAYPNALSSDLINRGIPRSGHHYHIAQGADPINTPNLFRYNFFLLLRRLIEDAFPRQDLSNIDVLKFISQEFEKFTYKEDIHIFARIILPELIQWHSKVKSLKKISQRSYYARSMRAWMNFKFNSIDWAHLNNLFYNLAFGTVHQNSMVWEDYQYLIRRFPEIQRNDLFKKIRAKSVNIY